MSDPARSPDAEAPTPPTLGRTLVLRGLVQGFGVRPTIYRLATELALTGCVKNTSRGVEIQLEGEAPALDQFQQRLVDEFPRGARLDDLDSEPSQLRGRTDFTILRQRADGPLVAQMPVDLAVCPECLQEVGDPNDRRVGYPLTSCTLCGPRYSIIRAMPYEREDTTMRRFAFCDPCQAEYTTPDDRRFHAQTNACDDCGPHVWLVDSNDRQIGQKDQAIRVAAAALAEGKIVALRGLGGYQLLVAATDERSVRRLRERKGRPAKPLAVLVESLVDAERCARLSDLERRRLASSQNPIVLCRARSDSPLAASVHPGLDCVGLLLPTTPLHWLLSHASGRPLVCTSGNTDSQPLDYQADRAERNLRGVADLWLHHDRPIERPIDDSVERIIAGRPVTFRLARGAAPLVLDLLAERPILATGGHLKAAAAWTNGAQAVLGPHLGDLDSLAVRERFAQEIVGWKRLYNFDPCEIVHDLHPDYFTTGWAADQSLPTLAVQHHHAHVVATMLEHGWLDRTALGASWDGTGYGTDATIWGGEFLICTATLFERFAHLRPFQLPGGEQAVLQPWRTAVAVLRQALGPDGQRAVTFDGVPPKLFDQVSQIADNPRLAPTTTSAGRLFDAAAAIALGVEQVQFEGQAAMRLEAAADPTADGAYPLPLTEGKPLQLDWRPLFAALVADKRAHTAPGVIATRFHRTLAQGVAAVFRLRPDLPRVLTGGVFQNRLLTEMVVALLDGDSQPLALPGAIPPGDGGLAAGQLAAAVMAE